MRMVLHCVMLTSAVAPSTNIMDMVLPYAPGFALWKKITTSASMSSSSGVSALDEEAADEDLSVLWSWVLGSGGCRAVIVCGDGGWWVIMILCF